MQNAWLTVSLEDLSKLRSFRSLVGKFLNTDIDQIREVIEGSYRIIYHIKADQIDVLAVIHGSMNVLRSLNKKNDQTE